MSPEEAEGVRDDLRVGVYALGAGAVHYRMPMGRTYLEFDRRETPGAGPTTWPASATSSPGRPARTTLASWPAGGERTSA
jgi:hypothetical protein